MREITGLPDRVGRRAPRKTGHRREITGLKTRHYRELREGRAEFAGGEGVEGAEAGGEFGGSQAAVAIEAAEKIVGRLLSLLRVAFHAAGDEVAVGIAAQPRLRHHVVQAIHRRRGAAQTVGASAALAGVNDLAQRLGPKK